MYFKVLTFFCAAFLLQSHSNASLAADLPEDSSAAAIYSYFDIGSDADAASLTSDSFTAQVEEIKSGSYNVIPLQQILQAQQSGQTLPRRTIALTFDRVDKNFIDVVVPVLTAAELPFTIFVSAGQLDRKETGVTWDQLRQLADNKLVTIGLTAYAYGHNADWPREKLLADINQSRARLREELDIETKLYAYPYGEYSPVYRDLIEQQGFIAAFGQQSGIASQGADLLALPRFTMTEELSDLDRFRMTSDALPFPVLDVAPVDMRLTQNPPFPGFTATSAISMAELKTMTCFASGVGKINIDLLGKNRVELRFPKGFDDSRGRINCTVPVKDKDESGTSRWRWLGFLYSVPSAY